MNKREEIIELSGQIINGIMSSDNSILTKILDRTIHTNTAHVAVEMAIKMVEKIDEHLIKTDE